MANRKLTDLTELTNLDNADVNYVVDTSDTAESAQGTSKYFSFTTLKSFLKTYFDTLYQNILVSGTNIKTINGSSVLGSGNLAVGGGKEVYMFEYASQTLPTTTNWQVSNYNSSQHDNLFRNNTATTYPTLNQDVGGHYIRKTGNVTKIVFKMLRRNPAVAIDFNLYVAKFVKVDGDTGWGTETIIANQNIVSSTLNTAEAIIKTLTLSSTAVTEGEHLYIAFKNNNASTCTFLDAQVIIITE